MLATQLTGLHKFQGAAVCDLLADDLTWLLRKRLADPADIPIIRAELRRRHNLLLTSERRRAPQAAA